MKDETRKEEKKWECKEAGREEKGGGAKGKISPCNDHGVEPQKPQSFAKEKVNIAKQKKQKKTKENKRNLHTKTQEAQNAAVIPMYTSIQTTSYTFIY